NRARWTCRSRIPRPADRSAASSRPWIPRSMVSGSPTISSDALARRFAALRGEGRRAQIPYITAGYPDLASTGPLLDVLVEAGADVVELGVPFSDPVADGPTIQRSSQRALENGTTLAWTLEALASFRERHDVPV